ncbi:MAG: CPBP family intramembrane glutamic endopeptidase [Ktedonobacterales bacterium]
MNTDDIASGIDDVILPPSPEPLPAPPTRTYRNTPRDTWGWLWKDTLGRVVPFALAGAWYLRRAHRKAPMAAPSPRDVAAELALGVAVGVPMAAVAGAFRSWVAPGYRLPTAADQALQTAFYFAVNAPAEEMFWRGMVQSAAINGLRRLPATRAAAPALGWAAATGAFGAYHRLGKWSWRAIAGVTVAGGLFGALYQMRPRSRRLLAPTIVHGFATAGFLSWGDAMLHARGQRRRRALR